ncbi:hypothetical protein [Bradyrhizobium sp. USDA 3364]
MADKTFSQLLAELKALDEPKPPLLVKSGAGAKKPKQIAGPALGLLLKGAIDDAVRSGRLSGTAAVAGLKALGLDDDGKTPVAGDAMSATLAGMSPDQQRAAVDHMVRLGKISGADAVACLRKLGLEQ